MSIATLKAKYKQTQNISHSNTFSLNGGRRNLPYIGKTYFKEPKSTCLSNDSSIIKTSTGSTNTIISSINKGPNVAKKGGIVCGAGPGSKASSEHTEELRKCIVAPLDVGCYIKNYVIEKGIENASNMANSNPQLPITYSSIVHDDFSNFTLEFHNVKKGYALKINDKYLNVDASSIGNNMTFVLDVNDSNYDASIFTKNVDNATMFSLLKSNDPQILNIIKIFNFNVQNTVNYIAANDPNVFYITIEYEGNLYFITQHNSFKLFNILKAAGILGGARGNEIQQWYIPDYTDSLFLTKNN
jgi:hypothetical protein